MSIAHSLKDTVLTDDVLITESVDFSGLLLSKHVLQGLTEAGFKRPSPIQLKAIPLGRCGLDLIVQAKSGTGKTCVFTVVALEGLEMKSVCVQVLVLAPTREIALQIQDVIQTIGKPMNGLKCHPFIGGLPLDVDKIVAKSCHIAVGTPGRVKQLIEIGAMKTNSVRMFILDEADKLLEEGFQETINWIYASLPQNKQILALSATYPEQLAQHLTSYMRNPTFVRLNTTDPALLGIKQYHFVVANHPMPNVVFNSKIEAVVKILSSVSFQQCLIFSNLQTGAQNLQSELVSRNWPTTCIAGFLGQKERNLAMEQLKTYKCRILISTDLTSRGIDADKVNLVINLDVPLDHETYLHRIGRAGRFGSFGAALTIVTKGPQETQLWAVEKKCRTHIHKLPVPIPNDLVTKPVPLRIDDIVSTEQIINQPALEVSALIEAAVASNHCQDTVSSCDTHVVTQLSQQNRQSSKERMLPAEAESAATDRNTALTHEMQAELSKADLPELPDKHVSDVEPTVVEDSNCKQILEPGPLLLHETAKMSNDSHSTAESEFRHETIAENVGKCKHEIPAENADIPAENADIPAKDGHNCMQEVDADTFDNGSYEILRGNCNEHTCATSTGVCSHRRHINPDDNLEAVSVEDSEEKNSVNCSNAQPAVQTSNRAVNLHEDLGVASQSNEGLSDECRDLEPELVECLETRSHESVSTVESDNCLASLEIVKCEEVQLPQKSNTHDNVENSGSCKVQYHSSTDFEKTCRNSLCDEDKPVLAADTGEENKGRVIRTDMSEYSQYGDFISSLGTLVNVQRKTEALQEAVSRDISRDVAETAPVPTAVNIKTESLQEAVSRDISRDVAETASVPTAVNIKTEALQEAVSRDISRDVAEAASVPTAVNIKTESLQEAVSRDISRDVAETASVPTAVNIKTESVCASIGVGDDGLVSDKILMVRAGISSVESNVKADCYIHPCATRPGDKHVKSGTVSSLATLNAEECSHGDNPISVSEVPVLVVPDACNYSKPSSGEVAPAEKNTKTSNHDSGRLPVKFRKPGIRRRYVKPFAVSEFLQYVNEGNSSLSSEESSYPFNDPDEDCNGDSERVAPADIGTSVQDPMPCGLNGGGDVVVASSLLPSRQHAACEVSPNEEVGRDEKESGYLHVDVLGGGDSVVAGANCAGSFSCSSGSLHEKSGNISDVGILGRNTSESQISVSGLGQAVEHIQASVAQYGIQPINAENVTQPINAKSGIQPINAENVIQPINAKSGIQPINAENVIQPINAKSFIQPINAENVIQPINAANGIQPINAENGIQPINAENGIQPINAENGIQPINAENGMFDSTDNTVNEPVSNSSPQTVCNSLPSASSLALHKSTNISLIDCLSSLLLPSHSGSRLPKFADLEADHQQFCSEFDNSMVFSCASELMKNLVLEDFEDPKDVQELCAVESARLALLKSTLKCKLLNAEEKRKAELPIEERLKLRKGYSGDKQMHQTNKHSDYSRIKRVGEKSEQDIDETAHAKQKARKGRGKKKSGKGRKGSDSLNWRSATDENYYERSAGEGHNFSSRKEVQKPQRKINANLNEQLDQATWKRDCAHADVSLDCTDDLTPNQSQLSECHGDMVTQSHGMLGKHDRDANKLNRQDGTNITESTPERFDKDAKQKQMKPSNQKDDECNMLDNMHAQMLLKRKLRKLEREPLSGADVHSQQEVTITENTEGEDDISAEDLHVNPSERSDDGCKILDTMHEQMLLKRKLKKLERQLLSCGNEHSNSCAADLSKDEETKILKTVDKYTEDINASTLRGKTSGCKESNMLLDIEGSVVLEVVSTKQNANSACKQNVNSVYDDNQKLNSNPEIKEEDQSQDAENMLSRKITLSREQSQQKSTERDKLVKFKRESHTAPAHRKPTKPSKTEARLAGLEVSDGSTSSTSDLSLSSASDISDVNSSDVDTKDVILSSQCYTNKYAQEGCSDPRYGKQNKKAATKKVSCAAYSTRRDNTLQDSASLPETEKLQHRDNLTSSMSTVPLKDSHSVVLLPRDQYDHQPYLIDDPITERPVKSGSKGEQLQGALAEQNHKFQHLQQSTSPERRASREHERANTLARGRKLSRNSNHNQKAIRHSDEFSTSDSEDISSDFSESDSHSYVTHHPNLYSYHNAMPWFPPYGGMHQLAYPTAAYVHATQPLTLPYYGPQTFPPLSYTHPPLCQGRQPFADNYPQLAFQWYTPYPQAMWYYVSHMTNALSHLLRKHRREVESKRERRRVSREE